MFRPCHWLRLIRLFPLMLVGVMGMNGCSTGQGFLSQSPESARAPEPARVQARTSAELPYYAGRRNLKVYSAPRRGARVLGTLALHQKVLRSEVQDGYARIRTPDGRKQGWVNNGLLIWRLPAAKRSATAAATVKCPPQTAPLASPAEPAAPVEQTASVEPPAPAEQTASADPADPAELAAPAEVAPPAENTDGLQARPGAEVFDRF